MAIAATASRPAQSVSVEDDERLTVESEVGTRPVAGRYALDLAGGELPAPTASRDAYHFGLEEAGFEPGLEDWSLRGVSMDSLMAVELVLSLERRLGVTLPAMALKDASSNIERLSARLAAKLSGAEQEQRGDSIENLVREVAVRHGEDMSAEELSRTVEQVRQQALAGLRNRST